MRGAMSLMRPACGECRELYECSCAELDTLIDLAKESGALAGRLTGAGWGGCMVALVPDAKASTVIDHLRKKYFAGVLLAPSGRSDHGRPLCSCQIYDDSLGFVQLLRLRMSCAAGVWNALIQNRQ